MIDLKFSLVIEATSDPNFFGFYSPELDGFTGIGHSIENCLYKARWRMEEHIRRLGATLGKIVFHVHAAIPSSWNRPRMPTRRAS